VRITGITLIQKLFKMIYSLSGRIQEKLSVEQIEQSCLASGTIWFEVEDQEQFKSKSIEEIILLLKTYNTKGKFHYCNAAKNRSLTDMFALCRHYKGEEVRFPDVLKAVVSLCRKQKLGAIWCPDIGRTVFYQHLPVHCVISEGAWSGGYNLNTNEYGYKGIKEMLHDMLGDDGTRF
jgi:hypothetical protein